MLPVANFYTKFREEEEMDEKGGSEVIFPSKTMKIEKQQQKKTFDYLENKGGSNVKL